MYLPDDPISLNFFDNTGPAEIVAMIMFSIISSNFPHIIFQVLE